MPQNIEGENSIKINNFKILNRAFKNFPDTSKRRSPIKSPYPENADGIVMFPWKNQTFFHPVLIAQTALELLDIAQRTGNEKLFNKSIKLANALINGSHEISGLMFFPYGFDYPLHGEGKVVMIAPWYSAMAQGQALSLFSRLIKAGHSEFKMSSEKVMSTFSTRKGSDEKWIGYVDPDRYLWLEEYPAQIQVSALNGFLFSLFGLSDYYMVTRSERAERFFQEGATTIRDNVMRYRNPGGMSYYDLAFKYEHERYHYIHIDQLSYLGQITGDEKFQEVSRIFHSDYHRNRYSVALREKIRNSMAILKGRY